MHFLKKSTCGQLGRRKERGRGRALGALATKTGVWEGVAGPERGCATCVNLKNGVNVNRPPATKTWAGTHLPHNQISPQQSVTSQGKGVVSDPKWGVF